MLDFVSFSTVIDACAKSKQPLSFKSASGLFSQTRPAEDSRGQKHAVKTIKNVFFVNG